MSCEELGHSKRRYEDLRREYAGEKQKLTETSRQRQLHNFLDRCFIQDHRIPNIGPGRKAILASFGIETAADILPYRIIGIKGFGEHLTIELEQWRTTLESQFVFDPSQGIDAADIARLNQKFAQRKSQLESALLAGPEVLSQLRADLLRKRQLLKFEVDAAAQALVQARADMTVFC